MAGDGDLSKFVWGEGRGEDDFAVDIGGIGHGAGGGGGIDQNTKLFADKRGGARGRDLLLGGHGATVTGFFNRGGDLIVHFGGATARLLGIGEDAHAIEFRLLNKLEQSLELGFSFAGKPNNESGANG